MTGHHDYPPSAVVGESAVPTLLPPSSSSSSALQRSVSSSSSSSKRRKLLLQPSKIAQFLEPGRFPMFECKETVLSTDDYGAANDDLTFQVIAQLVYLKQTKRNETNT